MQNQIPNKSIFLETKENLNEFLTTLNLETFRAKQIQDWIFSKNILNFDEMKNIPNNLRIALKENYRLVSSRISQKNKDPIDGTTKILIQFPDGESVENAIIKAPQRFTFCLSSQCGCPVACLFCASGKNGLKRNLTTAEIIEEFVLCRSLSGENPDNIVIMGVGEPLLNFDNLFAALDIICSHSSFGISPRRVTISTSGYVPGILKLAEKKRPWNLAISLHSTDDSVRKRIIPNMNYSVAEIIAAAEKYKDSTGRIVTIEYVLLDSVNSSKKDAEKLAEISKKYKMKINIIPFNPHPFSAFKRPSDAKIADFENTLKRCKVPFTRRVEKGANVHAACGQLLATQKMEQNNAR